MAPGKRSIDDLFPETDDQEVDVHDPSLQGEDGLSVAQREAHYAPMNEPPMAGSPSPSFPSPAGHPPQGTAGEGGAFETILSDNDINILDDHGDGSFGEPFGEPYGAPQPEPARVPEAWAPVADQPAAAPNWSYDQRGPSEVLQAVAPPPENWNPVERELDPSTYEAPTFVRQSPMDQDPVPVVEILEGNEQGRSYRLERQVITIGRGLENDVVLTDIAVSRRHLRIQRDIHGVSVEDLGSGNGTIINGRRLPSAAVTGYDRIELGNTVLRVVSPSEQPGQGVASLATENEGVSFGPASFGPPMAAPPGPSTGPSPGGAGDPTAELVAMHLLSGAQPKVQADTKPPAAGPAWTITPAGTSREQPAVGPEGAEPADEPAPRGFKLIMALLTVAVVALGVAAVVVALRGTRAAERLSGPDQNAVEGTEEQLFADGTQAFMGRRWEDAARAFEMVLALSPDHRRAQEYLEQAQAEQRSENTLQSARQALLEGQFDDALTTLKTIPASSIFAAKAAELRIETEERHAQVLVEEARLALSNGDQTTARARLDRALQLSPTNREARSLEQELANLGEDSNSVSDGVVRRLAGQTAGRQPPRRQPPRHQGPRRLAATPSAETAPTPSQDNTRNGPAPEPEPPPAAEAEPEPGDNGLDAALALYRSGNFTGAAQRAREVAASASGSRERRMARSVAGQIDRFHDAWRGALAASSRRDKLSRLESALRLDERIAKGHHGNKIRPLLMDVYVDEATSAWSSGRHVKACQSALRAINIGGSSSQARRIADQCEGKAQEYYRQGHALGESDLNQAKGLWRKVLNMVPRSSEVYSKAYTSLNNAGLGRYQDEDE